MATSGGVQSGGGGGGGMILSSSATRVVADSDTAVPYNGNEINIDFTIAAPPDFMDVAGNITVAGLYLVGFVATQNEAPTTPGLFGQAALVQANEIYGVDALAVFGGNTFLQIVAFPEASLPVAVFASFTVQADITGAAQCRGEVTQLATATA